MANMKQPRFKLARRLGLNVCGHPKANKRMGKGQARDDKKLSEYGRQLLEKQRLRNYYGVMEGQFKKYVLKALKSSEQTGDALVKMLETRLDNLVYRLGIASSSRQARQMVVHGHIRVNGQRVDIPSYAVQVGDVITLREKSQKVDMFKDNFETNRPASYPYLEKVDFGGKLISMPERADVPIEIEDQLVVEFYSRLV